jgi:hypothetical protein
VESQRLDSVRNKFHLHDFSHIGEEILEMFMQPPSALSKLLLKPADVPESIEDLPDVLQLAKDENIKQREQIMLSVLYQDQYEVHRSEDDDEDHDVSQLNVKYVSLKEQALFYGDIPDDDPIDYCNVEVGE